VGLLTRCSLSLILLFHFYLLLSVIVIVFLANGSSVVALGDVPVEAKERQQSIRV
jgi:hypothetical protein